MDFFNTVCVHKRGSISCSLLLRDAYIHPCSSCGIVWFALNGMSSCCFSVEWRWPLVGNELSTSFSSVNETSRCAFKWKAYDARVRPWWSSCKLCARIQVHALKDARVLGKVMSSCSALLWHGHIWHERVFMRICASACKMWMSRMPRMFVDVTHKKQNLSICRCWCLVNFNRVKWISRSSDVHLQCH